MSETERTADERALAALFAALVDDAPPSEVSPLEVVKLGKDAQRAALDQRIKRVKFGRNVLIAAAFAAVVALVFPHLVRSSSDSTASRASSAASSPAEAAAPGVAAPAQASAPAAGSSAGGSSAGGGFAAGSSSAAASGDVQIPGRAAASSAGSSAAAGTSAASAPAAPSVTHQDAAGTSTCVALPAKAIAAAIAALPSGYSRAAVQAGDCDLYGVNLAPVQKNVAGLAILVSKAGAGSCQASGVPFGCAPVSGRPGVYQSTSGAKQIVVYRDGYAVSLSPVGSLTTDQAVAVCLAVISSLG